MGDTNTETDNTISVAYLGPEASYTHQAALALVPSLPPTALHPFPTIPSLFSPSPDISHAIVPYANSTNGSVLPTLTSLLSLPASLSIVADIYLPIQHSLLVPRGSPQTLSSIHTLHSHPQAWTQCTRFLAAHLPHARRVDAASTSAAAAHVAALGPASGVAALASSLAAQRYGLDERAPHVADRGGNETRFLVLGRRGLARLGQRVEVATLLFFRGELGPALGVLGRVAVREVLTRPEVEEGEDEDEGEGRSSDGRRGACWRYVHFVEFTCRAEEVEVVVEELRGKTRGLRVCGTWECR